MARDSWGRGRLLFRLLGTSKRLDSVSDGVALKRKMGVHHTLPSGGTGQHAGHPRASQHLVRRDDEGSRPICASARRP